MRRLTGTATNTRSRYQREGERFERSPSRSCAKMARGTLVLLAPSFPRKGVSIWSWSEREDLHSCRHCERGAAIYCYPGLREHEIVASLGDSLLATTVVSCCSEGSPDQIDRSEGGNLECDGSAEEVRQGVVTPCPQEVGVDCQSSRMSCFSNHSRRPGS